MLFDSHAHLADERVFPDVHKVIQRARAAGVAYIVNVCTSLDSLERGLDLLQRTEGVFLAAAVPPHSVHETGVNVAFERIQKEANQNKLVAIGETGLDYHYHTSSKERQQEVFIQYLELAKKVNLPIIIHCREAFDDFFTLIDKHFQGKKGVLHCFTGTQKDADKLLEREWMVSFSGIVTFKKSTDLQEIAKRIPLKNLLIETDTPYLAPQKHRGKQNEPAFLMETAQYIADLKNISFEEVTKATYSNACALFKIPLPI